MEIPHRRAWPNDGPPKILLHESHSPQTRASNMLTSHTFASSSATDSRAMSIPNARDPVPPPLPPPRYIDDGSSTGRDIAWEWANQSGESHWGGSTSSVAPGSSLHGSLISQRITKEDRPELGRRISSTSTVKSISGVETRDSAFPRIDEGYYSSLSEPSLGSNQSVPTVLFYLFLKYRGIAEFRATSKQRSCLFM